MYIQLFFCIIKCYLLSFKASRGKKPNRGSNDSTDDGFPQALLPSRENVLIYHSTEYGYASRRPLFFKALSEMFTKYCNKEVMEVKHFMLFYLLYTTRILISLLPTLYYTYYSNYYKCLFVV